MKNLKKTGKRFFALFLSLVLALGIMQTSALAGTFDSVTVHFRVFDESTGQVYELDKTDTAYASQTTSWQSAPYKVPNLSTLIPSGASFGRVTKATATNVQTYESFNQGTTIYFSTNANSGTITYWVNWYKTGSGSGTGSNQNENVDIGTGGRYSWTQYIRYHSNYPDGTDYTYTVAYNIQSYTNMYNTFGNVIKTLAGVGFSVPSGYSAKTPVWNTAKNGSGTGYAPNSNYVFYQSQANKTLDLYAQYEATGGTPATPVTLTYMDGSTIYRTISGFLAGDPVTVIDCTTEKEGYTFEGWSEDESATTVKYKADDKFNIEKNTTLYAVWKENTPAPTTTTLTVSKIVTGDLTANQLPADFKATVTLQNTTAGTSETYELTKGDLEWTKEISLDAAYSVMVSESNYTLDNYDCSTNGKSATGVSAMGSGSMWFFTIAAGTTNPVCTVENNYTSKIPTILLPPTLKMELQRKDADGNWVTVADGSSDVTETVYPNETVQYVITVTNPNNASLGKKFVINTLDALLEMKEGTCKGVLTVNGNSTELNAIQTLPGEGIYGMEKTWEIEDFGANGVFTITYEAVIKGNVSSVLTNEVEVKDTVEDYQAYSANTDSLQSVPSVAISVLVSPPSTETTDSQVSDTDALSDDSGLGV